MNEPTSTVLEVFARTGLRSICVVAIEPSSPDLELPGQFPLQFQKWASTAYPCEKLEVEQVYSPVNCYEHDAAKVTELPLTAYFVGFRTVEQELAFKHGWQRSPWRNLYGSNDDLLLITLIADDQTKV
jgi:hypothetical protein